MCKPMPMSSVVAYLCFLLTGSVVVISTNFYLYSYYFDQEGFEECCGDIHDVYYLEFLGVLLAASGLYLHYVKFKIKLLLGLWIVVFVVVEIEMVFIIILESMQNWGPYSALHLMHICLAVYVLVLVCRTCKDLKYCSIDDTTK